jgi:hypothetical protein
MLSYKIFFVVFLMFGLIGAIRISDNADDLFFMHVNVNNEGTKDLDDLSVRVLIYDLGIVLQSTPFDLDDGDSTGKLIFWDTPSLYAKPGSYLARITVGNDDVREVRHRVVTIA